jgi:hypothetical protein
MATSLSFTTGNDGIGGFEGAVEWILDGLAGSDTYTLYSSFKESLNNLPPPTQPTN